MLLSKLPKIQAGLHRGRGLNFWFEDLSLGRQSLVKWQSWRTTTVQRCPLETPHDSRKLSPAAESCRVLLSTESWWKTRPSRKVMLMLIPHGEEPYTECEQKLLPDKSKVWPGHILNPTDQGMPGLGWSQGRSLAGSSKQTAVSACRDGLCFYSYW